MILWDVSKAQIIVAKGDKNLQLKDGVVDSPSEVDSNLPDDASEQHLEEKEISALCWASSDGSILAVGYIDGDILFWNLSSVTYSKGQQTGSLGNNVIKLQLSSAERRLPIIVLHWSRSNKSHNDRDGLLFIYGGDEIGSEEVLTVGNNSVSVIDYVLLSIYYCTEICYIGTMANSLAKAYHKMDLKGIGFYKYLMLDNFIL